MAKYKKNILIVLLVMVAGLIGIKGITYAKYAYNSAWDHFLKSKGFYFSSDNLSINGLKNVNNAWNGENIYFNIKNSINDNVITNYDISYEAGCEVVDNPDYDCKLNDDSNLVNGILSSFESCHNSLNDGIDVSQLSKNDCEVNGYEWIKQTTISNLYFNIFSVNGDTQLPDDINVLVTVKSLDPYSETLRGNFLIHKMQTDDNSLNMNYEHYENYGRLVISNPSSNFKCLKLGWDSAKLRIDIDNNSFSSYTVDSEGYINEIKFNIEPNSVKNYIFYGIPLTDKYNLDSFELTESSEC